MHDAADLCQRAAVVLRREAAAVATLADDLDASALAAVAETLLACRGHVLVTGVGTSAAVAQRAAHLLSCCGTPALYLAAGDALHGGAGAIRQEDMLYVISKGGRSDEVNTLAGLARRRGARVVAQTEDPASPLAQASDLVLRVVADPSVDPYGMIATGSSLVNAAATDALCVLLLEARGHSRQAFGETHPGGAVGKRLAAEEGG